MGVSDLPHCFSGPLCNMINNEVRQLVYTPYI